MSVVRAHAHKVFVSMKSMVLRVIAAKVGLEGFAIQVRNYYS